MSQIVRMGIVAAIISVADPGGPRGLWPPGPVKISHKKDGRRRRLHSFHVSRPPLPGRWIHYCILLWSLADLRGAPGTCAPPGGPNSFIFMQFSAKIWKIIAILGVGAPPWGKSWIRHWFWIALTHKEASAIAVLNFPAIKPQFTYQLRGRSRIPRRRGAHPPGGGRQHTNLPDWSKNCMKLRKFFVWRGARAVAPPWIRHYNFNNK